MVSSEKWRTNELEIPYHVSTSEASLLRRLYPTSFAVIKPNMRAANTNILGAAKIVFGAVYLVLVHLLGIAMPGTLSRLMRRRG